MKKIEILLEDSLIRAGINQKINSFRIIDEIKKIFLNMYGKKSKYSIVPKQVKEKILIIEVENENYISELKRNEEKILRNLEKKLKRNVVKRLRFQVR